jgi:hypothetical protein
MIIKYFLLVSKFGKSIRINTLLSMIASMFSIHSSIFQVIKKRNDFDSILLLRLLEIYLIACLIDYFSVVATYVEYVLTDCLYIRLICEFVLGIVPVLFMERIFFHFVRYLMMFEIQLIVFING